VPERSVELHRRIYRAFNAHDVDALIALCDPSIVIESVFGAVSGATYRGHDGVRKWQRDLEEAWGEDIRVEAEAYFDLGDHALAFDTLHGRGRQSGAKVALPGAALTRWRAGQCVYFKAYAGRERALSELGLSESMLTPISIED
jgi:ketosteroid isomerase-like protein